MQGQRIRVNAGSFALRAFFAIGLLIMQNQSASGQINFDAPRPIAPNLVDVERPFVTDIDGNGILDVILGSKGHGRVLSFEFTDDSLWNGRELISGDVRRERCEFADLNGDGFVDIFTGRVDDSPSSCQAALYLNDGHGSYGDPILVGWESQYNDWQVVTVDLNGDGAKEIVRRQGNYVRVWRYDHLSGTVQLMQSFFYSPEWDGMAAADLNGDGINELLLCGSSVCYWDPASGGSSLVTIENVTGIRFLPCDLNGDGRTDLITHGGSTYEDFTFDNEIQPFIQQVNGTFLPGPTSSFGDILLDLKALDSDGNGLVEVWGAGDVGIVRIELTADGTVSSQDTMIVDPHNLDRFVVEDVQGDGVPDVLAATMENRLLLWRGSPGPTYDAPPRLLFEWPHDLSTQPASLPNSLGGRDLCLATGTTMPYYGTIASTSGFTVVPTDGNGLDRIAQTRLTSYQWHQLYDNLILSVDIDGDGDTDVVGSQNKAHGTPCIVYALELDQGTGQFTERCIGQALDQSIATTISKIDVLDVDGDGRLDLLLNGYITHPAEEPNPPWDEYFDGVLFQTSNWVFEAGMSALPAPHYRDHADLDGDGDEDIVVIEGDPAQLTVYQDLGSGQFEMSVSGPFNPAFGDIVRYFDMNSNGFTKVVLPAFTDVEGDGRMELLRCSRTGDEYKLYFQTVTTNAISEPVLMFEQPLGVNGGTYALPSDFDRDGRMDLLVVDRPSFFEYVWSVLHNDGNFPLIDAQEVYHGIPPYAPFLHDEDGDGDDDLAIRLGPCLYSMKNSSPHPLLSIGTFAVYPNPSNGDVVVDLGYNDNEQFRVEVFDVTGRMVLSDSKAASVFSMDLGILRQGAYTLRVTSITSEKIQEARVVRFDLE